MTDTTTNRVDLSTATYTERRIALRDAVKMIGPDHFDMADWARTAAKPGNQFLDGLLVLPDQRCLTPKEVALVVPDLLTIGCGTAVCLIGTAVALTGWLPDYVTSGEDHSPRAICEYFGLHLDIPFREQWDGINLSDDRRTLDQIAFDYMDHPDGNEHEADWLAVLDYLADLIEHDQ